MFSRKRLFPSKHRRVSEAGTGAEPSNEATRPDERSQSTPSAADLPSDQETEVASRNSVLAHRPVTQTSTKAPTIASSSRITTYTSVSHEAGRDPSGLSLLYGPSDTDHLADIIFLHGLGGSSRGTWSKDHNLDLFWPREWLPQEDQLQQTRIFSYGYDAKFKSNVQSSALGISDFSRNLLFDLLYSGDAQGAQLRLGQVPIIFVAHSMGGLVFKKAFLDAKLDHRCASVAQAVTGVVFLSTPHHGADLAPYLNRLLSMSFGISTSKQYVADLDEHGPFLRNVNEQFRHAGRDLQIFSFYESEQTQIGMSSAMILDQRTANLGWPGEVSRSLRANHANMCKFETPEDESYKAIVVALRHLVRSGKRDEGDDAPKALEKIRSCLSASGSTSDHDYDLFCGRRAEGTCGWVLEQNAVASLLSSNSSSGLLWIHGRPGRGKSITASYLAQHLREEDVPTQYFFFRDGDESKMSIAALVRGVALQIAERVPQFRKALSKLADTGWKPKDSEWRTTWKKIFVNLLFELDIATPIYWIIDGLDEASAPHHLLDLLSDIGASKMPVKVILTSRWTPIISSKIERTKSKVSCFELCIDHNVSDMEIYINEELLDMSWGDDIVEEVKSQVLSGAQDSFLWVSLIIEELKECNTRHEIRQRLLELPPGMDGLYKRMEETISRINRQESRDLARQLLTWAMHARRSISADELADVLEPDFGELLDMTQTANRLCGHFITVEGDRKIGLIHQTARDYLTQKSTLGFSSAATCHAQMFVQCMKSFLDKNLRSKLQRASPGTYEYRATCWSYHLAASEQQDHDDEQLDFLAKFFSQQSALTWIYLLASLGRLKVLVEASRALQAFVRRKRKADAAKDPTQRRFDDLERLEQWSRDLLKILGKFGSCLFQVPTAIFTGVAPFCPTSSSIYRSFGTREHSDIRVEGLPEDWDDSLARVSTGSESVASLMSCSARHLAVGSSVGTVHVWDCDTFQEVNILEHGERISCMCFNAKGDCIATYGFGTTKLWDPWTGKVTQSIMNPPDMRALCLQFVDDDMALLAGTERPLVLKATTDSTRASSWQLLNAGLLRDSDSLDGAYTNSPTSLMLSFDGSKIAVLYRRFPATVWSVETATPIKRVPRVKQPGQVTDPLPFVLRIAWHPDGDDLLGLFMDGASFKFNIVDGSYHETPPFSGQMPQDIICSPDGLVYAICGANGMIRLFDYQSTTLIYQLNSDEMIGAFRFSNDGRRFYDIRGSYCTTWEPNVLMRLAAVDDDPARSQTTDESMRNSQGASERSVDKPVPILIMKPSMREPLACFGDEDGVVELVNYQTSRKSRVGQTPTQMCVEHLAWSNDGQRFCYAELNGRVTVMEIDRSKKTLRTKRVDRFKTTLDAGGLVDVLWLPGNQSLILATPSTVEEWTIQPARLQSRRDLRLSSSPRKWCVHPQSGDCLLSVTPEDISFHTASDQVESSTRLWEDIEVDDVSSQQRTFGMPANDSDITEEVVSLEPVFLLNHILIRISRRTSLRKLRSRFLIVDTSAIDPQTTPKNEKASSVYIPRPVREMVEMPLSVLSNGKLIFIDGSGWACSWPLNSSRGVGDVQRHFFIPRDWLPVHSLGLLYVTAAGAILCPRQGEVSVINSSIGSAW